MKTQIIRIKIAKWLDEYLGRLLIPVVQRLRTYQSRPAEQVDRILFIKFWGIGSIILTEPALRYLRKKYPFATIDFLTLKQNRDLFTLIPHVARVHTVDFHHAWRFLCGVVSLVRTLRNVKYDLIFDAEFFANFSALLAALAQPRRLVGYSQPNTLKNKLLDLSVPFINAQHAAENFIRLAINGASNESIALDSYKTQPEIKRPARIKKLDHLKQPYIVMNVNASPLALERRWPMARFVKLANWLLRKYRVQIVLIGSKFEAAYTTKVQEAISAKDNVLNFAGRSSLAELAALIEKSSLFISNDSGPLHLAAALKRPVVGFYGPETPHRFGPLCEDQLIFYLDLPCSPCMSVENAKTVNCTNHLKCMRQIEVGDVIQRIEEFISLKCPDLNLRQEMFFEAGALPRFNQTEIDVLSPVN